MEKKKLHQTISYLSILVIILFSVFVVRHYIDYYKHDKIITEANTFRENIQLTDFSESEYNAVVIPLYEDKEVYFDVRINIEKDKNTILDCQETILKDIENSFFRTTFSTQNISVKKVTLYDIDDHGVLTSENGEIDYYKL